MTQEERDTIELLREAKELVKAAFKLLDPAPLEPSAQGLVRCLDVMDTTIKTIRIRGTL